MAKLSYVATPPGQTQIQYAIACAGLTQIELAHQVGLKTRSSISKLINGHPVERKIFQRICQALQVDWKEVADLSPPDNVVSPEHHESVEPQADSWQEQRLGLLLLNLESLFERLDRLTQQLQSQPGSLALGSRNIQNLDEEPLVVENLLKAKSSRLALLPVDKPDAKKFGLRRSTVVDAYVMQPGKQESDIGAPAKRFNIPSKSKKNIASVSSEPAEMSRLGRQLNCSTDANDLGDDLPSTRLQLKAFKPGVLNVRESHVDAERAQLPKSAQDQVNQRSQHLLEAGGSNVSDVRESHADAERAQLPKSTQDQASRQLNLLKRLSNSLERSFRSSRTD